MSAGAEIEKPRDIAERTFAFSARIINVCQALGKHGWIGRAMGEQLLRSGTSIGANVEEAQGA